jgi:hypothetical protein
MFLSGVEFRGIGNEISGFWVSTHVFANDLANFDVVGK